MKPHIFLLLLFVVSSHIACDKDEKDAAEPAPISYIFEDGFETSNGNLTELFPTDGSRWSTYQQANPTNAINEISLSDQTFSEGQASLRLLSFQSDSNLSKIDIEKGGLSARSGNTVTIKADFYISGTASLENLFLIDLECCTCWDPQVGENDGAENQCPGVRLMMSGSDDYLSIERGKISGTTLQQTDVTFPRDQWVSVEWVMTLSDNDSGLNRLLINDVEVINESAMNMPNAQIFRDLFADEGIDFQLQGPTVYERVQVGATANPMAGDIELFVDNFSIKVE